MINAPPEIRPKLHTIRGVGKKRHARPGEVVQLYYGLRTKACFQIGTGICTKVRPIVIRIGERAKQHIVVDREPVADIEEFAKSDGFGSWAAMVAFWKAKHAEAIGLGGWQGLLIEWEPMR